MKKLNKLQKFIIASLSVFIGLAVVFGLSANIITTCAEDVQNSTENTEILDNSATDEEVIDGEETIENGFVYDAVGNVYYYVDPDNAFHTIMFTILENEKLKIDMFDGDDLLATVYGQYDIQVNKLAVYANNEWMGVFVLYPDGRAIEYVEEDNSVLDEETDETDNGAILDEIKDYLDSRKDENGKVSLKAVLADAKTWIVTALSFLGSTGLGAIILGIINRSNKRKEILTDAQVESIATAAANKAVEKVVGKSIDVDISAEVSKAVKKELYALSNSVESLIDGVKNTEMLVASEAVALSHSRIINADEKKALLDNAKRAKAHAGKVVSAAKIEIEATEPSTKSSTKKAESVEEKNMHYINFGGVEKK